ncbi:MAG: hypothetical protein H6996_03590 [Moraxellaceae bacterium]|nr:hypothetical protein [Pseudomonadales bacterium]MCB1674441.1 hypothetical protein [Pseudomonadales bacterium]MCP5174173.1 hypothetical protein [Moraxellaceae bacterium]MCP5178180.1 hypothetical protein [Moraxellaceae bacterium]HQV21978.1 hypothetical protein [Agitococcus sp.]
MSQANQDNQPSSTNNDSSSTKTLTLSALLAESLQSKKEEVNYPQPDKVRFSQRPSRPPHGTRRAMGKR